MAETALNFGPDWLRALAHGPGTSTSQPPPNLATMPKYSLAQYRYGREEMLALIPKDPMKPECLKKDTSKVVRDTFILPLALTPHTEDEQRLWARSVNSDAVLRASGKSVPGNNMGRSGRGGSVDRGRGRGRNSYYQRGITHEENEDGPPTSFIRPKPIERSQSASEKDQRWDDRDRRFDRTYSGRGGGTDDSMLKSEPTRNEYWRKFDKEDESDWRSTGVRSEKIGARGSWRNPVDKDRRDIERNPSSRSLNGNLRTSHSHQKIAGNHLPEWSVDESNEQDVVGTFDSSGAFLEPKLTDNSLDDIYVSDDADEGMLKDNPEAKKDNSKKTPKKSNSQSQLNTSAKQNVKQNDVFNKSEELGMDMPKTSEPQANNKTVTNVTVNKTSDHVIKPNNVVQHHIVNSKKTEYTPVTLPNVPDVVKSTKKESVILNPEKASETSVPSAAVEEDAFAHHKKATENMVAQWTEEEEQRVISQTAAPLPEKDNKWYYQDPQGEIQGPFASHEMLEWFTAGYFTMSLMVRRTCDEKFSQLGDLIKSWGRVPFTPGNSPPPIRVTPTSLPTPVSQTIVPNPVAAAPVANQLPKQEDQLVALQQQLLQQQFMQQQLMLRQAQLQQVLAQLKQQDNFTSLNSQQQQQVLLQHVMAQQQMPRPNLSGVSEQPGLVEAMAAPLPLPLLGLPIPSLLKNDLSLWNLAPTSSPWPMNVNVTQSSGTSIWDTEPPKSNTEEEIEKQKRASEEQERLRKAEEERLAQEKEIEEKRKLEELRRKQEEERLMKELQKQEEEKKRLEEQQRREEEKRRQEELRKLEEQKRKEEELRKQEELRKIEEQKRLEELKRIEEQRRLEELKRKEEERRQEELRKLEEQRRLEEKRKKEELQKKIEMEKERERIELEKQKEANRLREIEREQMLQREKEEEMRRLAEIKLKAQGPAWGLQNSHSDSQLSLADIQRLQEEKDREEREERIRQQLLQQQAIKQAQQSKNGLSWAKRSADVQPAVKSLAEIQQEEAERLAQQQRNQKPPAPAPVINSNVGVWGNSSHLNRITATPPSWNMNSVSSVSSSGLSSSGFWDDALSNTVTKKQTSKTNDISAFPALANHPEKPATTVHSNKSKNVRAKKEEDAVSKLFAKLKPTDEFTTWCTEALSAMPSSVDVPTFVAFLKDVESPYEVHDYVRSYLGDGKEPREFAKLFLDKRSKFRSKQTPIEENTLWGPAPAVNPVVNKSNSQPSIDSDGNSNSKGKTKRRKGRMQKLDSSMLGFTVQSNPDRLNVGEIDHVEGM